MTAELLPSQATTHMHRISADGDTIVVEPAVNIDADLRDLRCGRAHSKGRHLEVNGRRYPADRPSRGPVSGKGVHAMSPEAARVYSLLCRCGNGVAIGEAIAELDVSFGDVAHATRVWDRMGQPGTPEQARPRARHLSIVSGF